MKVSGPHRQRNRSLPIVMIGAGGIVRDAHLPAYRLAGYRVAGIFDLDGTRAATAAKDFQIPEVYPTLAAAAAAEPAGRVFDVAVPAAALGEVLSALPDGAAVLMQKPFGQNLKEARSLLKLCQKKGLKAAVNFQLRYAPQVAAARRLIEQGAIGEVHDIEARVTVYTPWQLWTFLQGLPRVEVLYHSIHYVDLIRSFWGEPAAVQAKTLRHPSCPELASTRTNVMFDYGDLRRANLTTNHGHNFGLRHQESYLKWEGTRGAIKATLGLLLNYPTGEADALEMCQPDRKGRPKPWRAVPFRGSWFPHAFVGTMASVQDYAAGRSGPPSTRVEDAFKTMAVVEAIYRASGRRGEPILS